MRIAINLASRPYADIGQAVKGLRTAMAVLALVAAVLLLGLRFVHEKAEEVRARAHSLDSRIASIRQERQGYESLMRQPDNARTLVRAKNLNQLFDEKAFSWTLAMEDLETVLPAGVQVTTIEPIRAKNGQITLRLRVLGPRDRAVGLVENLEHSRRFVLPRIVGESAESAGGPGERAVPVSASNRVEFEVLADYNPASLADRKASRARAANSARGKDEDEQIPSTIRPHRVPYMGTSRPHTTVPPRTGGPR